MLMLKMGWGLSKKTNVISNRFRWGQSNRYCKAIAIMSTNDGHIANYMGTNKVKIRAAHCSHSTTAGTGSEVTKVTIVTDTKKM